MDNQEQQTNETEDTIVEKDIIDEAMVNDDYDYDTIDNEIVTDTDVKAVTQGDEANANNEAQASQNDPQGQANVPPQKQTNTDPNQQQPVQGDPKNPNGYKRVGAQFADGNGNIVDKDGKVLAAAGQGARLWQEASRATAQVNNLTRQNEQLMQERKDNVQLLDNARQMAEMPRQMGLNNDEFKEGITLLGNWRKNPVEVAKEVVARTMALGYNATDILGTQAGDALEMRAVTQLVNQSTAPMREQQEQAARQAEAERNGNAAYNTFITKFPDAEVHQEAIANLMGKGRPAETAYYEVKTFALENGLDFTQPLGPQIAAKQGGQSPTENQPKPMVNGGGRVNQNVNPQQNNALANADDDWSTILHDVMSQT